MEYRGEKSHSWKNKTRYCEVCNKVIDYRSNLCLDCYHKKIKSKHTKYTHCIDCGKLKKHPSYGKPRCYSCCKKGKLSPRYGKTAHGKHIKYSGIWFKSSYEYLYAKYLSTKKIIWQYEPKAFDLKNGSTYTPDFYLPELDIWIEVKGWWRQDAIKKFKRFKKLYKNNIIVINKISLKNLKLL